MSRRKTNSSKVNLSISLIFHGALVVLIVFFAAREGMLGRKLKEITVTMAPKEKKPEPPKEKPPEPKLEPPKSVETPKVAAVASPPPVQNVAPPPPVVQETIAAPAAVNLPAMDFSDGAKDVQSVSDPNAIYKGLVEHALRSRWNRPEDIADDKYVAELELSVDKEGNVTGSRWLKGSGDLRWDNSVKAAVAATKVISRPPPKDFPGSFLTRFDVESQRTEEVMHLSSK